MKRWTVIMALAGALYAGDTVLDSDTGLMWQDSADIVKKDWQGAKRYCADLSLGGYSDWRLPHIDELMSISDKSRYKPAIKPIFKHTKSSWYWSATEYKNNASSAWVVFFSNGNGSWGSKSTSYYVRCVRGGR